MIRLSQEAAMRSGLFALLLSLYAWSSSVAADPPPVELREPGTNLFADRKVECILNLHKPADFKGRLTWVFAAAANDRVFDGGRGEAAVVGKGADAVVVKIPLATPTVNPGVILEARLTVNLIAAGADKPDSTFTTTLWIFPPDPFTERTKWLKDLAIVVFDPNEKSPTVEAFEALKIPHTVVRDAAKLADQMEGTVIVGEGVSFKDEKGLADALLQCARRGCRCLCLAATEGNLPIPAPADDDKPAASLAFQRRGVIRQLDKRLDSQTWNGKDPLTHSIHLVAKDTDAVAEIQENVKGWPWMQTEFDGGGKVICCQFALMKHWDASPTPRYLFARILETLNPIDEPIQPK